MGPNYIARCASVAEVADRTAYEVGLPYTCSCKAQTVG